MTDLHVHRLALLLEGRCSGCAERLPSGAALRGRACSRCGAATALEESTRGSLSDWYANRSNTRMWIAILLVAAGAFLTGMLPVATSLLVLLALGWIRWTIVVPGTRLLGTARRMVSQWLSLIHI